jgi:hypothetical protein
MRLRNAVAQRTGTITQPDCDEIAAKLKLTTEEATGLSDTRGVLCGQVGTSASVALQT